MNAGRAGFVTGFTAVNCTGKHRSQTCCQYFAKYCSYHKKLKHLNHDMVFELFVLIPLFNCVMVLKNVIQVSLRIIQTSSSTNTAPLRVFILDMHSHR